MEAGNHPDRGQGVKKCGDKTYCCGASGDCCSDSSNIFTLDAAEVVATISASSAFITSAAADSSTTGDLTSGNSHRALTIGLGVGIGVGGFLLIALAVLYLLKRRAKAKANAGYEEKKEVSELDSSWRAQLQDSLPAPTKSRYAASSPGVVHEIASGRTEPAVAPQELDANTTYDWEPRNEPQPRDGGFRPEEPDEHQYRR